MSLVILAVASITPAYAEPPPREQILLRAVGPHISSEVVGFIADNSEPHQLASVAGKTPREVIKSLCGGFRTDYYAEFGLLNNLEPSSPDTPLPSDADKLLWPTCLYITRLPATFVMPADDPGNDEPRRPRLGTYQALTGGDGTRRALRNFYTPSRANIHALHPKFLTAPVQITLKSGVKAGDFLQQLQDITRASNNVSNANAVVRGTPVTEDSNGQIITGLESTTGEASAPQESSATECDLEDAHPINVTAITSAYAYATMRAKELGRARSDVYVTIVDNGFFGANPERAPLPEFGDFFPEGFFSGSETLGPKVGDAWPINYENGFSEDDIDSESGHGTHVAGLVLGGPDMLHNRDLFTRPGATSPWLQITFINIGKGRRTLVDNSAQSLGYALGQVPGEKHAIVNMSIAYDLQATPGIRATFTDLFLDKNPTMLFVVAAGNDYDSDVSDRWFPAAFGGESTPNVISVAAHNNHEMLTDFTNRGEAVDIAAPGCRVHSWLNEKGRDIRLSGTSQSAPLVTLAAALLKSVAGEIAPRDMKARLIASGTLLGGQDFRSIRSGSMLDIPKALYVFDDYIRVNVNGTENSWLGSVSTIRGVKCPGEERERSRNGIFAYKSKDSRDVLFYPPNASGAIKHCSWTPRGPDAGVVEPEVHFVARARVSDGGVVTPCIPNDSCPVKGIDYQLSAISELVLAGPYTTH